MAAISYQQIHEEIQQFENNLETSSQLEEPVVTACKALLKNNLSRLEETLSAEEQFNLFFIIFDSATMSAREASNQKTAMAILLFNMRNIVLKNVSDKSKSAVCELLRRLSSYLFFRDKKNWQTNFKAITQGGTYTENITKAVIRLEDFGLLSGEHAQANFEAISKKRGGHAGDIANALRELSYMDFLISDYAQAYFEFITQEEGQHARKIAAVLKHLNVDNLLTLISEAGLSVGKRAEANFEVITQGWGEYAEGIASALLKLKKGGLLTGAYAQANFEAISKTGWCYAEVIASALIKLNEVGLLTGEHAQANREAITQGGGEYAGVIAFALIQLNRAGLLTGEHAQANFEAVTQEGGRYAEDIAAALFELKGANFFINDYVQAYFELITKENGQHARKVAAVLKKLDASHRLNYINEAGLLIGAHAQANFETIMQGGEQYGEYIGCALIKLNEVGLLTGEHAQANRDAIIQGGGRYAIGIACALFDLKDLGLLTGGYAQENFKAIVQKGGRYAWSIYQALKRLNEVGLLTGEHAQANFEAITQGGGQYAGDIASTLIKLNTMGLLTEDNRKTIMQSGQCAPLILKGIAELQIGDFETEKRYFNQWLFRLNRSLDCGFSLDFLAGLLEVSLKGISDPQVRFFIFNLLIHLPSQNFSETINGLNHEEISEQEKTSANIIFDRLKTKLHFHDLLEQNPQMECGVILFEIIQLHESVSLSVKNIPPVISSLIKKTLLDHLTTLDNIILILETHFKTNSVKERCDILSYLDKILGKLSKDQIEQYINPLLPQEDQKDSAEIIEKLRRDSVHLTKGGNPKEIFSHVESEEHAMDVDISASSSEPVTVSSNSNKKRKFMGGHGTFKEAPSDKRDLQPPRRYNQTPTLSRPG